MLLDATMTATRRPDLIDITLRSFDSGVFHGMEKGTLYLNIDPVWGDDRDDAEVEAVCRRHFPSVVVRRPEAPSFGAAVKWLWSQPRSDWFLHLEDDWVVSRPIASDLVRREATKPNLAQIRLANWSRLRRRRKLLTFSTSPGFVRSEFARLASRFMNPALDPEKQFRDGLNPALQNAVAGYEVRYHGGMFTPELALDIGREWREQRQIRKAFVNGTSVWIADKA